MCSGSVTFNKHTVSAEAEVLHISYDFHDSFMNRIGFMSFSTERAMSPWLLDEHEKRMEGILLYQVPEIIDQL
jgi:hypothetical protein